VAAQAGLAKGTLYLYFATKEELFLSVQEQQFERWFDQLDARLGSLAPGSSPAAIAELLATSFAESPALVRLLTITHTLLERNAGVEAIARFKDLLRDRLLATGALLEAAVPGLRSGHGARLLLHAYALVVGLYGLAEPTPAARQALNTHPGLEIFAVDFAAELRAALIALLRGQA
jgi:AcrR family transcriptional regulator